MWRTLLQVSILSCLASCAFAAPLTLADGRPFVGVYYFTHWWEPWRSSDERILDDFAQLRKMGNTVICLDHEWSQAIDNNWSILDRSHKLAKQGGMQILPWLSLKVWTDLGSPDRMRLIREWYGEDLQRTIDQKGEPAGLLIWDEATIRVGARYTEDYLKRYADQALLHLNWEGKSCPVVALSVELAWHGGFDEQTNLRFQEWLAKNYGTVNALNNKWGTAFSEFAQINPRDEKIFDYANYLSAHVASPQAIEDHVEFRSQIIAYSLNQMAAELRKTWPDVLILAELPYQMASDHPHAQGYRVIYGTNPSCVHGADILFFRCTGPLSDTEARYLQEFRKITKQPVVLSFRTYCDWGNERPAEEATRIAEIYAKQALEYGDALAFYSWNEMVDTHLAPTYSGEYLTPGDLNPEQSQRAIALTDQMMQIYLDNLHKK